MSCGDSTESFHIALSSASPSVNILHNHGTVIKLKYYHCYLTIN